MKIVMVSCILNIHQAGVADELYRITDGNYWFIQTEMPTDEDKKGGDRDFSGRPYLVLAASGEKQHAYAMLLIKEADVMLFDDLNLEYLKERISTGKLTFNIGERWLKKGIINLLSPRLLRQQWFYHTHCHGKPFYNLCASAYAASDFAKMFSFRGKCFKWGYFTAVPELNIVEIQKSKRSASTIKILWVARFLQWKHPERMLQLASQLRDAGEDFVINMIGDGPEYDTIATAINDMGLQEYVHMLGTMPNSNVMEVMRSHHIFCFTSDKNEGWGAVLNEAMSNGCCPVASIETGSTPYLIEDGVNGFSFNLNKEKELYEKVRWLIQHTEEREKMSIKAYHTVRYLWSPQKAAENLVKLSKALLSGKTAPLLDGPCSSDN